MWAFWLARDAGDLAAQYAWTTFVRQHPASAYNLSWYGGIHPASYSIISPYLMAWIGVAPPPCSPPPPARRSARILLTRSGVRRPLLPSLWLAVAVWCNIACGRITYTLGMAFALLAAALVLDGAASEAITQRRLRPVIAALLGVGATMCSPVAGLFIEVLAAALFVFGRRRDAYLLAPGPVLGDRGDVAALPVLRRPAVPGYSALPTAPRHRRCPTGTAHVADRASRRVGVRHRRRAVRGLPTPIGSNVERLRSWPAPPS